MADRVSKTVLCVDDDPSVLKTLTMVLKMHGYNALTATTIQDAIATTKNQSVDVALIDHSICKGRGSCSFDELRESQPSMKVLIHTGNPEIGDCAGKAPIIPKPIDPRLLVAEIERLCVTDAA